MGGGNIAALDIFTVTQVGTGGRVHRVLHPTTRECRNPDCTTWHPNARLDERTSEAQVGKDTEPGTVPVMRNAVG